MKKFILFAVCVAMFGFNAMAMNDTGVVPENAIVQQNRQNLQNVERKRIMTRSVSVIDKNANGPVIHKRPVVRRVIR